MKKYKIPGRYLAAMASGTLPTELAESSSFDIPRSAIISQHLSLSESVWCVDKMKKR